MLAQRADRQAPFSRRDLGRLLVASGLLVLAMTAIFAVDIIPNRIDVGIGQVATADILAPRAITYTSDILTAQTRDAARKAVEPQYDFTPDKASAVARQQALAFARVVAPVDNAFDPSVSVEADRIVLLETAIPGLSDEARANLMALPLTRWAEVRKESARILDQLEASELRDADLAEVRARLAGRILGGLNEPSASSPRRSWRRSSWRTRTSIRPRPTALATVPPRRSRRRSWRSARARRSCARATGSPPRRSSRSRRSA